MMYLVLISNLFLNEPDTLRLNALIVTENYTDETKLLKKDLLVVYPIVLSFKSNYSDWKSGKITKDKLIEKFNDEFISELFLLTKSQGRLLIKIIHREFGKTAYDLIFELKGEFKANFYQYAAQSFGNDLKIKYNLKKDYLIENLIIYK